MKTDEVSALLAAARFMAHQGWVPATSGNLSLRCDGGALISPSGLSKAELTPESLVQVDAAGRSSTGRPSAETLLHLLIYRRFAQANAVLHSHGANTVVLSRRREHDIALDGYELAKALAGVESHLTPVRIPVIDNDQDMARLVPVVEAGLERTGSQWAFVLRGHGVYAWGGTVSEALRHLEALDTLFNCELIEARR